MASSGEKCPYRQRAARACGTMTDAFKVLRHELIADDGSGTA